MTSLSRRTLHYYTHALHYDTTTLHYTTTPPHYFPQHATSDDDDEHDDIDEVPQQGQQLANAVTLRTAKSCQIVVTQPEQRNFGDGTSWA